MRNLSASSAFLGLALVASSSTVAAQSPPFDAAIDVQTFEYAVGPKNFFTVSNADVGAPQQLTVDAVVTFLTKPFTIYNVDPNMRDTVGTERTAVVETVTAAQLTAAYGISDRLQIGANLPIVFQLSGDGLMPATGDADPDGLNVTGLGDLLVEGKYRLLRRGALKIGAIGGVTLPSSFGSGGSKFIGDDLPTVRARLALQYDRGKLSLGANGGAILRKPRKIYDSTMGQQLAWGVAAAVRITDRFSLVAEGYGRTGLPDFSLDASPLEVGGGMRVYVKPSVAVVIGGGAGLVRGIGSPESRFFISLGYAPDVRDSDGDGIPNARDKCPLIPEDFDGFEDDDGCPDEDADGDLRPDIDDKCPYEAEDFDGFDDDDGCPDLDNDGDGLPDLEDKCPDEAEDGKEPFPSDGCPASKRDSDGDGIFDDVDECPLEEEDLDGFEDGDGCPDLDNDHDGIPDVDDRCPLCPEDKDGFEDDDGCPDLDNDRDGLPDAQDACPGEAETINGFEDEDGCPDQGAVTVRLDGDRLIVDRAPTLARGGLSTEGKQLADQLALVMRANPDVTSWLVALSQPKAADAARLAEALKAHLVARGVPAAHLQVLGTTGPARIGGVVKGRAPEAGPVCPAGLEVKPRPEASKPADAAAATAK